MQNFLPYPDFAASARVLDQARLGKQRVETLQTLRALVIPDYGWVRHPAIRMWMGYVPALTAYGLAVVSEWVSRGHADSTYRQILEFAPEVLDDPHVPLPPWFGEPGLHLSHRSNLIQKAPEVYRERFPGTPEDLPYSWPEPAEECVAAEPAGRRLWVWRSPDPFEEAADILLPPTSPGGSAGPKWGRQLRAFEETVQDGDAVAVLAADRDHLRTGHLGPVLMHEDGLLRPVRPHGVLSRSEVHPPALLQDPRTFFGVDLPPVLVR
ncbi:hypothetical protein AC792_04810 [Arthrobacter sp. RIT-PI-e]|uniref:MSMEG_6728 family protein n=1 Tax=Arthrobacter sp. RIT-PI-e TaxID=1681197 RepID=UPI0006761319|nr:MSMEG_6728 family protein [Arthrobacter sp. RIT-PI-e]KNC19701.1 hypothetical protein AC792_04810 [Arthrobacter sp. RIT-PI-e]